MLDFENRFKFLIFASPENSLLANQSEKVEILEVCIDYQKAFDARKKFYEQNEIPLTQITKQDTLFFEHQMPIFDDTKTFALVLDNKKPNGKTITLFDSCGCCTTNYDSYDYVFNKFLPNNFVESAFLPYTTKQNELCFPNYLNKNMVVLNAINYVKNNKKSVPSFFENTLNDQLQTIGNCHKNSLYTQSLANSIWMKMFLKNIENQKLNEFRKDFLSCIKLVQIQKCSLEDIAKQIVQENEFLFITNDAKKMWARSYTTTGKILNHFAGFEKSTKANLDQQKYAQIQQNISNHLATKVTLRFFGVKAQKLEQASEQNLNQQN